MESSLSKNSFSVLSIGTEVVSGQIINTNSALISKSCESYFFNSVLHISVPDDRASILKALKLCSESSNYIFITGGLGPTTDDFTREVASDFFKLPLIYHNASFEKIKKRCEEFKVELKENQKQQCYYPKGAEVYENHAGTANAFCVCYLEKKYFFLPGPPIEIQYVFKHSLNNILQKVSQENLEESVEKLFLFQTLGQTESVIATITEEFWKNKPIQLGYRVHFPYVEIKVWVKKNKLSEIQGEFIEFEKILKPFLLYQGEFNTYLKLCECLSKFPKIHVYDLSVSGAFIDKMSKILEINSSSLSKVFDRILFSLPENIDESKFFPQVVFQSQVEPFYFLFQYKEIKLKVNLDELNSRMNKKVFKRQQGLAIEKVFIKWLNFLA